MKIVADPKVKYELFMLACQEIQNHQYESVFTTLARIREMLDFSGDDQMIVESLAATAAAVPDSERIIRWLRSEMGATFKSQDYQAIRMACTSGQTEVAQWMMDQTHDNYQDILAALARKKTLTWVMFEGRIETARWLVSIGYDHQAEAPSPVFSALKAGRLDAVRYLVDELKHELGALPREHLMPLLKKLGDKKMIDRGVASLVAAELNQT